MLCSSRIEMVLSVTVARLQIRLGKKLNGWSRTLVPDILSFDLEDDILGKVLGVMADMLQGLDDQNHADSKTYIAGIFHDISQKST
jgi:hypothetical protein